MTSQLNAFVSFFQNKRTDGPFLSSAEKDKATGTLTLRNALRSLRLAAEPSPPSSRKILARPSRRSTAHRTTMRCLSFMSATVDLQPHRSRRYACPPQRSPLTPDTWPLQLHVACTPTSESSCSLCSQGVSWTGNRDESIQLMRNLLLPPLGMTQLRAFPTCVTLPG